MPTLKSSLHSLVASFAEEIVRALQTASLNELIGQASGPTRASRTPGRASGVVSANSPAAAPRASTSGGRRGRLKRRSADDIAAALERIVALLKTNPGGLRAEQIRKELGMLAKELPRPLGDGLAARTLRKKGQKRATVYFAGATGAATQGPRTARKK